MDNKLKNEEGVAGMSDGVHDPAVYDEYYGGLSLCNPDANGLSREVNLDWYHNNRKTYLMMQSWQRCNGRL